jgi:hypothetical protein
VFIPRDTHSELQQACGRWTIAFARALHAHLQDGVDLRANLKDVLSEEELDILMGRWVGR